MKNPKRDVDAKKQMEGFDVKNIQAKLGERGSNDDQRSRDNHMNRKKESKKRRESAIDTDIDHEDRERAKATKKTRKGLKKNGTRRIKQKGSDF